VLIRQTCDDQGDFVFQSSSGLLVHCIIAAKRVLNAAAIRCDDMDPCCGYPKRTYVSGMS